MKKQPVTVIVCRVGRLPVVEPLMPDADGSAHLDAIQAIVGGTAQLVYLENGMEVWCNEEAIPRELPHNRAFETPHGVELFRGDLIIAKSNNDGTLIDVEDSEWLYYLRMFEAEDIEAAKRMNGSTGGDSG